MISGYGPRGLSTRLQDCLKSGWTSASKTALWLISVTVPISFATLLLQLTGLLDGIAGVFAPLFSLFGLPGEAALVFVTSCLLNIYAAIMVMETLNLPLDAATILALMCLISHNLPVETTVQRKTGSRAWVMVSVRLGCSFVSALVLQRLLPMESASIAAAAFDEGATTGTLLQIRAWFLRTSFLCAKIVILITVLMILQRLLEEFGGIAMLAKIMKYPLVLLGIPHQAAFLWIVANTLGLSYGAGVLLDHVQQKHLPRRHANLLNYHIAVSHSLLEDTCLFVAIGVSVWWITIPRILLAGIVVWLKRIFDGVAARRRKLSTASRHITGSGLFDVEQS